MSDAQTAAVIDRFNQAFLDHDPDRLDGLVGADCRMESSQPAPDGATVTGGDACLAFWRELAADTGSDWTVEEVVVAGERATIRWRFRYGAGAGDRIRGVNLMLVRDGLIVEALGYAKTGGELPLPADG